MSFVSSIAYLLLFFAAADFPKISAIEIDNKVEGDPEVECEPQGITVLFNLQDNFNGYVYVKGVFGEPACQNRESGERTASITVPFDGCNAQRTRSLNPRGIYVSTTVIIAFHEKFITKVDRAYRVQCFYMESEKSVSQDLEVSMLTTGLQTQVVPMPICRYEILGGGPEAGPVKSVMVGQKVFHKWTCETPSERVFCMNVHSCYVDDGKGDRVDLLDQTGCGVDKYLLNHLEYITDLMAGQVSMVFKYADRPQLFFNCQIAITIREDETCPRAPCAPLARGKRSAQANGTQSPQNLEFQNLNLRNRIENLDVTAQLSSLDLDDELPAASFNADGSVASEAYMCSRAIQISIFSGVLLAVLLVSATIFSGLYCRRNNRSKNYMS